MDNEQIKQLGGALAVHLPAGFILIVPDGGEAGGKVMCHKMLRKEVAAHLKKLLAHYENTPEQLSLDSSTL